jgi:cellulose synthase catalytic subunit (UDP-forming)
VLLGFAALLPMHWQQQAVLAAAVLALALWLHYSSRTRLTTLALMLLSVFSTARYAVWRVASVNAFLRDPASHASPWDVFFLFALLLAESYAFAVLLLGYMQTAWPLDRAPVPLPDDPEAWPAVDVLVPTLNEPLDLVRTTALAAMNIDWPGEKLRVWILDDGRREEFRAFAAETGIGYLARGDNTDAKAGNINYALKQIQAPFVAVFDCDQVPTRSFLQVTMGWLLHDARLAMVQTPHRFYSPDPFERNLKQFGMAPGEEQLFHGVIQSGNDLWNAVPFCGTCAVLRRAALDELGGLATETVTEDVHTSLRLQKRGWNTAYINLPQSAGLATERLREHIRQRTRWARGMMQVLRLESPLFSSMLHWQQRLCYLNAAAYFLCALPRLVFLIAPAIYLVFGRTALPGLWAAIAAYALPHLLLASLTRARIYGRQRNAFWNEIYETVMAPYILLPTLTALFNPRATRFRVTEKGGVVEREFYDVRTAMPYLLLLLLNVTALTCAGLRLAHVHPVAAAGWMRPVSLWAAGLYGASNAGAVWINAAWALFNVSVLSVAAGAARERTQRRKSVRVAVAVPADVILADGTMAQGITCDLSQGGMRARTSEKMNAKPGDRVAFILPLLDGTLTLPATVVSIEDGEVRAQFGELGLREAEALTTLLYSRADAWLGWGEGQEAGSPIQGAWRALRLVLMGARHIFGSPRAKTDSDKSLVTSIAPVLLVGMLCCLGGRSMRAQANTDRSFQGRDAKAAAAKAGTKPMSAKDLAAPAQIFLGENIGGARPVSIVFATAPSAKAMQAAGIIASWIGVASGDKLVHFAVSVGVVPAGNAVVLVDGPSPLLTSLRASTDSGATVSIVGNPNDPASSVLLLSGNDDDQLLTAAIALALHGDTWQGAEVRIGAVTRPAPRAPDDAPRWLSTEHVATFAQAQIRTATGELQGDGSQEVVAVLRLPPDLDYEDGFGRQNGYQQNLALHLDYRYNAVPLGEGSTLQVYVNGAYVSSTPMPHSDKASEVLETVVPVPVADMQPGDNEFSFRFAFRSAQNGGPPRDLMGAVLKDSYLDINGIPHWTKMPDLALFARAGYPLTRRADLADTAIVLPTAPTPRELEAFLALMARMGAQTGLPAVNVTVTDASAIDVNTGKDLLVLGTPQDQPAIAKLDAALPVEIRASELHIHEAEGIFGGRGQSLLEQLRHWRGGKEAARQFGEMETTGELPDATLEEIEWPRGSGRTSVVIALRDDAAGRMFADAINGPGADAISQSVSVLHGSRFSSYRLGGDGYWAGALPLWMRAEFLLEDSPWLVAMVVAIVCGLFAALLQARLRRQARERLQTMV